MMPDTAVPTIGPEVIALGMVMAEISPPRLGLRIGDSDALSLHVAGSATIFATALARLGNRVGLISKVGDDELGEWMLAHIRTAGIDDAAVAVVPGQLTPLLLASVDREGNKTFAIYRFAGWCDPMASFRAVDIDDDDLRRGRVFDLSEASLRHPDLRREALALTRRARALGLTVCFSPNFRIASWDGGAEEARDVLREGLALADLAVMNEDEAMLLAGAASLPVAADWLAAHGPPLTVVTRGAFPTLTIDAGRRSEAPVFAVDVVYDIGAGDVFHAGYLAAWLSGADPVLAARFAAAVAALKISRPPDAVHMPDRVETIAFLRERGVDPGPLDASPNRKGSGSHGCEVHQPARRSH
jgi:2-dehydro-3-deoxygluconokinase